jgi:hypothetical protein
VDSPTHGCLDSCDRARVINVEDAEQRALRAAAAKDGVLTWAELQALGVSEALVRHRLRTSAWQRAHVGVYVLTPVVRSPLKATARAALAAAPPGAIASHQLAGQLHRLRSLPALGLPEVTVGPEAGRRTCSTLIVHRAERLERTKGGGIPATPSRARSLTCRPRCRWVIWCRRQTGPWPTSG